MYKLLPFEEKVPFTSYSQYAFYLGILAADGGVQNAVFNHFISLCWFRPTKQIGILELPICLRYFSLNSFSLTLEDPLSFFKAKLREGKYVHVWLNHKAIAACATPFDFIHDFLIYGFDDEEKTVYAYGFIHKGDMPCLFLQKIRIPYAELLRSYKTARRKKSVDKNNYTVRVRRPPETSVHTKKLKLVLFFYLHDLLPSLPFLSLNQKVFQTLKKSVKEVGFRSVGLPVWKFLVERAELLLALEQALDLPPACQESCREMKKLLSSALLYCAVRSTNTDVSAQYCEEAAQTFCDNLSAAQKYEKAILSDIYNHL